MSRVVDFNHEALEKVSAKRAFVSASDLQAEVVLGDGAKSGKRKINTVQAEDRGLSS